MATNTEKIREIQKIVGTTADGLWGPNTRTAVAKHLNCEPNNISIQEAVGTTADGIVGSCTLTAILRVLRAPEGHIDVFLDPGHTADNSREYPAQFEGVDWTVGKYKEIADILGFTKSTKDSLEHMLNVRIAKEVKKCLEERGKAVMLYDDPSLSNSAEIRQVYTRVNANHPKVFVSIHNNAAGAKGWERLACTARGPVALYYPGRSKGKDLGERIVDKIVALKGPDNRYEHIHTSTVSVLRNADSDIPATLIEVGFYDNLDNLYFMATHLKQIGKAIADGITSYIG